MSSAVCGICGILLTAAFAILICFTILTLQYLFGVSHLRTR